MIQRFTREVVDKLAKTNYFQDPNSPACVAVMPFVKPEHVGVEIGVFMGTSSKVFLEHCDFMYFIDPCKSYEESSDPTVFARAADFRRVVEPYGNENFQFIVALSADAAPSVRDVDFVFIDGNHAKEFVAQDVALYWPKVKPGGFLSGHDYNQEGVKSAVNEFASKAHLPVEVHQYCWLIKKP
jgi:predicted O-methyltransferase YrrM